MRDPHVVSLIYTITLEEGVLFQPSPFLKHEDDLFSLHLEGEVLTIKPKLHYASREEARKEITPFLRAWQLDDALRMGKLTFRFEYKDAEIVDRDPPLPGDPQAILLATAELTAVAEKVSVVVPRIEFPHPPTYFSTSPDVETLWHRYEMYTNGKEPLPSMAFFCLTLISAYGEGKGGASRMFKISRQVLRKYGELTSLRGDPSTARKYIIGAQWKPMTPIENAWLEIVTRAIIRRLAELSVTDQLPVITMADFPTI